MIYVTQGHPKGVGLEIFLKSFVLLSKEQKKKITLVANRNDLKQNLEDLKLDENILSELNIRYVETSTIPSSSTTLIETLQIIKTEDILITLPTSKDQLIYNNKQLAGYTEFFRNYFNLPNISMTFKGIEQNVLLITDHLPLNKVTQAINSQLIYERTKTTLNFYSQYFGVIESVVFSGINPHAGENGILGTEDPEITKAINLLKKDFSIPFLGPYSGDTLHMHQKENEKQLFVYMYHDQGLAQFKAKHGLIGLNVSMGLPFLRLSVDHGTAFDLYGKNKANLSGMMFLLKCAFEVIDYVDKRN